MLSADGALGILLQLQFAELHLPCVIEQETPRQRVAAADQQLDDLVGLTPAPPESSRSPQALRSSLKATSPFDREGNGTPSSTPAWQIPWMEEPGRLQSMGSLRVRHD